MLVQAVISQNGKNHIAAVCTPATIHRSTENESQTVYIIKLFLFLFYLKTFSGSSF